MSVNIYDSSTDTLTKVPGTETNAYKVDDTAETTMADDDYVPFYDTSATARRKSTWANIVAKIKSALGIASSGSTYLKKDGTWGTPANTVPTAYCDTAAATAAKVATCTGYSLLSKSYLHVVIVNTNTAASAITLNVNGKGAKPIYINGSASSASNYTLTAGSYIVYYNGTNYYFRTDGLITGPGIVDIGGNTSKFLRGDGTWQTPTNTTYSVVSTSANGLAPKVTDTAKFLKGDGTWATPTNTWTALTGATSSANGTVGYINAAPPKDGYNTKFFRADGTWQLPVDSTKLPLAGGTMTGRLTSAKPIKHIVTGSGSAAEDKGSGVSPRYFPAKWTFNTGVTAASGDIITIKIPVAGHSYGVFMSIDNGTTYYPVVGNGTTRITTEFAKNNFIMLQLDTGGSAADMYALDGADARATVTGGVWRVVNFYNTNTDIRPSAYCETAAATAAKVASCSGYALASKSYIQVIMVNANSAASAITLNINSKGAKPIYINGAASSASNYTLPAGSYLVYYNGTNYYFRTDGLVTSPGIVDIGGNTSKFLRGDGTWQTPTNTTYSVVSTSANGLAPKVTDTSKYLRGDGTWATPTNTTYSSKTAASGGTDVSLCTTGEKYTWNNKSTVPTNHKSAATTYGVGGNGYFGHVDLTDTYTSNVGSAANGVGASQTALYNVYSNYLVPYSLGSKASKLINCSQGDVWGFHMGNLVVIRGWVVINTTLSANSELRITESNTFPRNLEDWWIGFAMESSPTCGRCIGIKVDKSNKALYLMSKSVSYSSGASFVFTGYYETDQY